MRHPIGHIVRQLFSSAVPSFDPESYSDGVSSHFSGVASLLSTTLQVAVPLWVEEIRQTQSVLGDEQFSRWITEEAKRCSDVVAEHGDKLMFRGKKGQSAIAFNALAKGVACLSFCPGGITLFGTHWEFRRIRVDGAGKTAPTR